MPQHPSAARRWLVVLGLLAVAALLRVSTMFYHDLSGEDATVALIGKHVLSGEDFPAFFYRQTYMGSLNGIHLVPALFVFGHSVLTVRLNAVAYSLLFPLGLYLLGRRVFDEATARVALVLAAVPPFLLTYWSTVAEPHFETNIFGVVLLLLALAVTEARREPRYLRVLFCFGLMGGLAFWTSFKVLEVLVPALLLLWLCDPSLPWRRAGAFFAGGFVLGSLPAWLFYAVPGHRGAGTVTSIAYLLQVQPAPSVNRLLELATTVAPTLLGTYYWPVDTSARRAALGVNLSVYAAACALAVALALRRRWRDGAAAVSGRGLWLLLLTLVTPFAMLYAAGFEVGFDHESARYVLPAYIPLLLFVAALVVRVGRRWRIGATALLAFLLAFNVWTNLAFVWPLNPAERARRAAHVAVTEALGRYAQSQRLEALYVHDMLQSLAWAFRLDALRVSDVTSEIYLPNAVAADAATRVAYLDDAASQPLATELDGLAASYRSAVFGPWVLLEDVRIPPRTYRLIPRTAWRNRGEESQPAAVGDGDLGTFWEPSSGLSEGAAMTVDLGSPYSVERVLWWPSTELRDTPALLVSASSNGLEWRRLGMLPISGRPAFVAGGRPFFRPRNGWLELRFGPRPIRYLRFALADSADTRPWGIGELRVYEGVGSQPETHLNGGRLASILRVRGVTRLLADPALSARVAAASGGGIQTLPANGMLDSHGRALPPARLAHVVSLRATDALLVPREDAEELAVRLTSAGLAFTTEPIDDHVLVRVFEPLGSPRPCRRTRWRVSSGVPEADGRTFRYVVEAELQGAQRVVGLRVEHPLVSVRHATLRSVAVSDDGARWRAVAGVRRLDEWTWAGRTLFRFSGGAEELLLPPTPARHVRVELELPYRGERAVTQVCARGDPVT